MGFVIFKNSFYINSLEDFMSYQTKRGFVNAAKSLSLAATLLLSGNVYSYSHSTYPSTQPRETLSPFNEKMSLNFPTEDKLNIENETHSTEKAREINLEFLLHDYTTKKRSDSEIEKALILASARINDIFYDKILSDLDFSFNFGEESDYHYKNKTLNEKGISLIRQGLEYALEQTALYKNAQEVLSDAIQATLAPTFNFLEKIFGERFADRFNTTVGLDLGTDPFKDPYIRDPNSRYDLELRPNSLRINAGGGNTLKFNLKPNGLGILYKENVGQRFYFVTGAEIIGGMQIEELDFSFKENKWGAYIGVEGDIGKGWGALIRYSANYCFPESSDPRNGNEEKIVALFSKSF